MIKNKLFVGKVWNFLKFHIPTLQGLLCKQPFQPKLNSNLMVWPFLHSLPGMVGPTGVISAPISINLQITRGTQAAAPWQNNKLTVAVWSQHPPVIQ
jgi:hypothetical protein